MTAPYQNSLKIAHSRYHKSASFGPSYNGQISSRLLFFCLGTIQKGDIEGLEKVQKKLLKYYRHWKICFTVKDKIYQMTT